jgi:hypothetical protein
VRSTTLTETRNCRFVRVCLKPHEVAIYVLALIVFFALMVWAAIQWM